MTVLLVLISNSVLLWLEDIFCRYQCFEIYLTHFTMILKNIFPSSYNCYLKEGYSNQVYTCITYLLLCNKLPQLSTLKEHIIISQFLCVSSLAMAKLSWPSQSILKEINPEYSLEGLMMKLQYFSHLMQKKKKESTHRKRPWCWERLRAGGEGTTEDEMAGWHHRLDGYECEQTLGVR